jgi:hypothetical protein
MSVWSTEVVGELFLCHAGGLQYNAASPLIFVPNKKGLGAKR